MIAGASEYAWSQRADWL